MSIEPIQHKLSSYFLNLRRIADLVNDTSLHEKLRMVDGIPDQIQKQIINATFQDELLKYLNKTKTPTLEQLLYQDEIERGKLFTCHRNFYCKGLVGKTSIENVNESSPLAEVFANLREFSNKKLIVPYHPIHLTSSSSWVKLTGNTNLMVIGVIDAVNTNNMRAIPLVLADVVFNNLDYVSQRHNLYHGEINIDSIDSFKLVNDQSVPDKDELNLLKDIPENDVKNAFADIIEERVVDKDWGGEQSDLFSARLKLNGERIPTAFLFKGPSSFAPMKARHLGKNGDQIDRLFNEPASLLILQHCHEITKPVRNQMKAYASQAGNLRLFCVIDGFDTLRLLRAYSKCGL